MDQQTVILVVDDDSAVRNSLASLLFPCGYHLIFAMSGHDSIRKAVRSEPDLIVLNPKLQLLNGFDLCRLLRENSVVGQIPILLLASEEDFESRKRGIEEGADGFILMPFESTEVRSRIKTALRLSRFRKLQGDVDVLFHSGEGAGRQRRQLEALSRRLLQAQEEERRAIARELHDEVGQILTVLKINLVLTQRAVRDPVDPRLLTESIDLVDRLIGQVRDLWRNLRPALLDELGLPSALQTLVDSAAKRSGIDVVLDADPHIGRFHPEREITCYRVVQESLTNVIRHSRAKHARVELTRSESELELTISDDGIGFDVEYVFLSASAGSHMGLLGMRERLSLVGGRLQIESSPGQGTRVRISLPLQGAPESLRSRKPRSRSRSSASGE